MSKQAIEYLTNYAKFLGVRWYDIGEQRYNNKDETVLTIYIDKEKTQELEHHIVLDKWFT